MTKHELYEKLSEGFRRIVAERGIESDTIHIVSRALSPEEAIGITERKDYPILAGREIMLQAEYMGAKGQAFTDAPSVFHGTLAEVLALDLAGDTHARGLFIASMNAVMKKFGLIENTVHCRGEEPEICAKEMKDVLHARYDNPKVLLVGYQPALLDVLSKMFKLRVLDLDPENIGQERYGVRVEDGAEDFEDATGWADLILCTGSTLSNGSITDYIGIGKEVVFFGTTVSGAAKILGLKRLCFCAA
jgi:uncharacterized protein (DUF4213/DUF364 family)